MKGTERERNKGERKKERKKREEKKGVADWGALSVPETDLVLCNQGLIQ